MINKYTDGRMYKHNNKDNLNESATEISTKHKDRKNKYRNIKTTYNGIRFDSKKEMGMYIYLERLEREELIDSFKIQVAYILQEGYKNDLGKKIRDIKMVLDFVVYKDEIEYIIDCKSPPTRTKVFNLKKKLFEYKFRKHIHCIYSNDGLFTLLLKNLA